MTEAVLDASVIIAILRSEQIDAAAFAVVDGGVMSAVNVAEVYASLRKLSPTPISGLESIDRLLSTLSHIVPFDERQARAAGLLREPTRSFGLSPGDRACLALAIELGAEIYTTDKMWANVNVGVPIHMLR